jgi:S1-C subfamily serine protease
VRTTHAASDVTFARFSLTARANACVCARAGYAIPSSHIRALLNDFVKSGSKFITPRPSPPPPASGEDEDATPAPAPAGPKSVALSAEVIRSFPYLGVALSPSTVELCRFLKYSGEGGVFVRKIAPRGIAHDAGLKPRDLLLAFDGHKLDR